MTHSQKVPFLTIVTTYQNLKRKYSLKTTFLSSTLCTYNKEIFSTSCCLCASCKIYEVFKTKIQFSLWIFVTFLGGDFSLTFNFCPVRCQSKMVIDFTNGIIKGRNSLFIIEERNTILQ